MKALWLRYWCSFTHFPLDWLIVNIHGFCSLVLAPLWLTGEQAGWNFGIVAVHACVIAFASEVITKVSRKGSLLLIAAGLLGFGVVVDIPKAILLYYAFGGFGMCAVEGGCLPSPEPSIGQVISTLMPFLILRTPFFVLSLVATARLMNKSYRSDETCRSN